jgi:Molybdate transporter of MFS superfamily
VSVKSTLATNGFRANLRAMRFNLMEFSGGLGDLGTFIPLAVAMSLASDMDIGVILIFAGIANILTGVIFGLPVPVQPMKAIAAVAIAEQLAAGEIAAAGLLMGVAMVALGVSGAVEKIKNWVPLAVVRGIQLGVGIKLAIKGFEFIAGTPWIALDGALVAVVLGVLTLALTSSGITPTALGLFAIGAVIMFVNLPAETAFFYPGSLELNVIVPTVSQWQQGLLRGALPQLPLTILNSVIAICALSGDLFPGKRISNKSMATSVGAMNLLFCWFGAMPMCHGSGGLAGQYHFGARTGGSVVMLGVSKLLVGALLGVGAMTLLQYYPLSILGTLLIFAGIELSKPAMSINDKRGYTIMTLTVIGILAVNTFVGFSVGIVVALFLRSNSAKQRR